MGLAADNRPTRLRLMPSFSYLFVDAYENVRGIVEAPDPTLAAIQVLIECGTEPNRPRHSRYGIREQSLGRCPRDAELVIFSRMDEYVLELKLVGSRKRKPLRLYA